LGPDREVNVAPMGPHLPDLSTSSAFPRRDPLQRFVLKPFRTARTYQNLKAHGEGVLHVTDDVLLLAQAAVGVPDPFPPLFPAAPARLRGRRHDHRPARPPPARRPRPRPVLVGARPPGRKGPGVRLPLRRRTGNTNRHSSPAAAARYRGLPPGARRAGYRYAA